jgi:DNA replication initiation complex subunit (GINS family)
MTQDNKYKRLLSKASYLSLELEYVESEFQSYKAEFVSAINNIDKGVEAKPTLVDASKNLKDRLSDEGSMGNAGSAALKSGLSRDFKSLYKQIMRIVHPDKVSFIEDKDKKAKYNEYCSLANNAISSGNYIDIIKVAVELDIELESPSDEFYRDVEKYCRDAEDKIDGKKKSYAWVWFHSDAKVREILIKSYFEKN